MTVQPGQQRHEDGQAVHEAEQRSPGRPDWPRQSSTSSGDGDAARAASRSYGGNASATSAPLTAAPASRGPSPRGRQRDGAVAPPAAAAAGWPVAVVVTMRSFARPAHRRRDPEAGDATAMPGLRRYNASSARGAGCRRRGVRGRAPETGQGPDRPSDRPRPAGCRIEGRCLLGGRALPVSHPPGSPSPGATPAVGPGTRTALAHCAVPGPKPARDCRGGRFVVGVLWWTSLTLVAPSAVLSTPR